MLNQTHSQDSASDKEPDKESDFEKIWKEMDEIEPLTPLPPKSELECSYDAFREAAIMDDYLFGDYDYIEEWKNQWESNEEG